jgi:hypothetical protein
MTMKVDLSRATTMTAAMLVLASSVLVGTNALGAASGPSNPSTMHVPLPTAVPPFKLTCAGYGDKQVIIANFGKGPVPAGTSAKWNVPKSSAVISGSYVNFIGHSGTYTFAQGLAPDGQVGLNIPTPAPGADQGPGPPPEVAVLAIAFLRACTINVVPTETIRRAP